MRAAHHVGAAAPGLAAPSGILKDETPGLAGTEGSKGIAGGDACDSAQTAADGKRFSTLQARAALAGYVLGQEGAR